MNAFPSKCCHFCCLSYANCSPCWTGVIFVQHAAKRHLQPDGLFFNELPALPVSGVHSFVRAPRASESALFRGPGGGVTRSLMFGCFFTFTCTCCPVTCTGEWLGGRPLSVAATCCLTLWRLADTGSRSPPASFSSVWYQQLIASLTSDWSYLFFLGTY